MKEGDFVIHKAPINGRTGLYSMVTAIHGNEVTVLHGHNSRQTLHSHIEDLEPTFQYRRGTPFMLLEKNPDYKPGGNLQLILYPSTYRKGDKFKARMVSPLGNIQADENGIIYHTSWLRNLRINRGDVVQLQNSRDYYHVLETKDNTALLSNEIEIDISALECVNTKILWKVKKGERTTPIAVDYDEAIELALTYGGDLVPGVEICCY